MLPFAKPPENRWIKAQCVIADLFSVSDDQWPSEFRTVPREGDFVESNSGRRMKIVRVTHRQGDYEPVIELELGNDTTDVTPTSGGSTQVSMESE